ncbi:RnfABCDGE type electron transport complex subunit D [Candidatus Acetothermia bacterium]|nr:RnfABCDGE type electron transport complex subunit D [Candidatus Acetothermia bacterium]MBI3644008.1 RnfABCDGE type electron transport complex subunit D [Candidatus Acetothermia bacterium]
MSQSAKSSSNFSVVATAVNEVLYGGSDRSVSGPPYLRDGVNVQRFFTMPLIAAAPAVLGGIFFFGLHVLAVILVALVVVGVIELIFSVLRGSGRVSGLLVIAVLFSLLLPPNLPLWIVAIGAGLAALSRQLLGGLGFYLFNPVLVGKALLIVIFPVLMTTHWAVPFSSWPGGFAVWAPPDAQVVATTPLSIVMQVGSPYDAGQLLLGNVPGAIGATSGILMLFAGFWMLFTRTVNWRVSIMILATVGIGEAFLEMLFPTVFIGGPLLHLLGGSLLFTAFLIASDPVTSPMTLHGKLIYGVLIGLLVLGLRAVAGDNEGVTFSVLLANASVPLLNRLTTPRSYGRAR